MICQYVLCNKNKMPKRAFNFCGGVVKKAERDKVSRLETTTSLIANGTILFPNNAGPWWPDFKKELLSFPGSIFKDQCDAFSQGVIYIDNEHISGKRGMF